MTPVPIAERWPGTADLDHSQRCWWGTAALIDDHTGQRFPATWTFAADPGDADTHWLPATVMPVLPVVIIDAPDLDHPSLSAADRNPSLVGAR